MTLDDLTRDITHNFQCCDGVKFLLYETKIECYEITDAYTYVTNQLKEVTRPTSYSKIATIYVDTYEGETTIECIDSNIFSLITKANYETCNWLTSLINQKIDNYEKQPKLNDIESIDGLIRRPDNYEEDNSLLY